MIIFTRQDVQDPSVIVSFPLLEDENVSLIAWTTTPWTLPSNLALCVNAEFQYVKVKGEDKALLCRQNFSSQDANDAVDWLSKRLIVLRMRLSAQKCVSLKGRSP